MTPELEAQILDMRRAGAGWSEIGRAFGRHHSTIQKVCRRNGVE